MFSFLKKTRTPSRSDEESNATPSSEAGKRFRPARGGADQQSAQGTPLRLDASAQDGMVAITTPTRAPGASWAIRSGITPRGRTPKAQQGGVRLARDMNMLLMGCVGRLQRWSFRAVVHRSGAPVAASLLKALTQPSLGPAAGEAEGAQNTRDTAQAAHYAQGRQRAATTHSHVARHCTADTPYSTSDSSKARSGVTRRAGQCESAQCAAPWNLVACADALVC
jgi:hypothetical protein